MIMINDGQKSRHIDDTKEDISVTGKNPDIDIVKQIHERIENAEKQYLSPTWREGHDKSAKREQNMRCLSVQHMMK